MNFIEFLFISNDAQIFFILWDLLVEQIERGRVEEREGIGCDALFSTQVPTSGALAAHAPPLANARTSATVAEPRNFFRPTNWMGPVLQLPRGTMKICTSHTSHIRIIRTQSFQNSKFSAMGRHADELFNAVRTSRTAKSLKHRRSQLCIALNSLAKLLPLWQTADLVALSSRDSQHKSMLHFANLLDFWSA